MAVLDTLLDVDAEFLRTRNDFSALAHVTFGLEYLALTSTTLTGGLVLLEDLKKNRLRNHVHP